jgi:hypothetical protein
MPTPILYHLCNHCDKVLDPKGVRKNVTDWGETDKGVCSYKMGEKYYCVECYEKESKKGNENN